LDSNGLKVTFGENDKRFEDERRLKLKKQVSIYVLHGILAKFEIGMTWGQVPSSVWTFRTPGQNISGKMK
jgi:hypothetical protein